MRIDTAFDLLQRVRIVEIAQPAKIINIQFSGLRVQYQLEYWWNGEIKVVWLFENEVAALDTMERSKPAHNSASNAKAEYIDTPF
jgi:hypothetical protein